MGILKRVRGYLSKRFFKRREKPLDADRYGYLCDEIYKAIDHEKRHIVDFGDWGFAYAVKKEYPEQYAKAEAEMRLKWDVDHGVVPRKSKAELRREKQNGKGIK